MTQTPPRRRAPGMSPERRKAMIVSAALPLLAEYGTAVTTSQIARAAGIGEATIFRVFADKEELLGACMKEAVRPDHAVKEIASIPLDQPLSARLVEALEALDAHLTRIGTIAGALMAGGHRGRGASGDPTAPRDRGRPGSRGVDARAASMAMIRDAVADLFEPERDSLRLSAEQTAAIFVGLMFARPRLTAARSSQAARADSPGGTNATAPQDPVDQVDPVDQAGQADRADQAEGDRTPSSSALLEISPAELVEVFLHGALAPGHEPHERQNPHEPKEEG
ncbi:helix-turn-helix domain-containing protein [Thermopolyspora sp. NPDC052614]|uniref:TetR/AcrR family transcriptional regulator n=1 Tax=Thermopolyspora sp. NPDC052614 TaxID=3155682 RepID=UPI00344248C7